jgi:DNA-binding GntR family transcriptional regulator
MAEQMSSTAGKVTSLDGECNGRRISRSSGLAEEVYKIIRADIMSLRILPGARISVDSLARELGVSQTPIREALSMLEATGLVTKQHYIGYCAAPKFNSEQYRKLFEVRLLLEPCAARHAAQKMDADMLESLDNLAAQMEPEYGSQTSYERFADQDSEFHARIAAGGGNDLIAEALDRLHTHLHVFRLEVRMEYAAEAKVEHARIALALKARDPEAAEAAMREHIQNSFQRLIPFIKD